MEKETEQGDLDSWDEYVSGNFLKAAAVGSEDDAYVVVDEEIVSDIDGQGKRIRLKLERNESKFDFDLNKTNAAKLKDLGLETPKAAIGKKIYFRKVIVRNPRTNIEVDSLRISKIE